MVRRDMIIAGLIAVELAGMACFFTWRRQRAKAATANALLTLSIPSSAAIGMKPEFFGKAQSPYTLVEFGDYQCPPCAQAYPQTHSIVLRHDGRLKFLFRHYPLNIHPYAVPAANAAEDARQQGKFWQMHEALYKLNGNVDADTISAAARSIGVKTTVSLPGGAVMKAAVQQDRNDGDKVNVLGTPTFILCCPDGKVLKLAALSQAEQFIK